MMHPSDLKSLPVMSCAVCRTCRRDPFGGCVAGGPFNGYRYKEVTMGGSKAEPAYKSPYPEPSQIGSNSKAQQQAAVTNGVLAASTRRRLKAPAAFSAPRRRRRPPVRRRRRRTAETSWSRSMSAAAGTSTRTAMLRAMSGHVMTFASTTPPGGRAGAVLKSTAIS